VFLIERQNCDNRLARKFFLKKEFIVLFRQAIDDFEFIFEE